MQARYTKWNRVFSSDVLCHIKRSTYMFRIIVLDLFSIVGTWHALPRVGREKKHLEQTATSTTTCLHFWKCWWQWNLSDLGPKSRNDITLRHMYIYMYPFSLQQMPTFVSQTALVSENPVLGVFLNNSIRNQIWPLHKKVKDQPGIIIWTYFVVLECPIRYSKFQWSRPFGSEEVAFKSVYHILHGGHFAHVTRYIWTNFRSPIP